MITSYLDHLTELPLEVGYQDDLCNPSRHTESPRSEQPTGSSIQKTLLYTSLQAHHHHGMPLVQPTSSSVDPSNPHHLLEFFVAKEWEPFLW